MKEKLVSKSAQEIFWEENIEKLSLAVDRMTIMKLRELMRAKI